MTAGAIVLAGLVSTAALPRYYAVPKQAYRRALEHAEARRQPGGIVLVVHLAESGVRYYGPRYGIREGVDYFYLRSIAALERTLAVQAGRPSWLIVTFPRALRIGVPDLEARIRRDWVVDQTFPGTVGDGDLTVWRERSARAAPGR
jgi:hypothetical protein